MSGARFCGPAGRRLPGRTAAQTAWDHPSKNVNIYVEHFSSGMPGGRRKVAVGAYPAGPGGGARSDECEDDGGARAYVVVANGEDRGFRTLHWRHRGENTYGHEPMKLWRAQFFNSCVDNSEPPGLSFGSRRHRASAVPRPGPRP
jgi:hypothetical protein